MPTRDFKPRALELKAQGLTYVQVASQLNAEGFKTKTGKKIAEHTVQYACYQGSKPSVPATVSYQRIPPLPEAPPPGHVMVIITRPDQLAAIAKGVLS